jgi:CheY-like chemotaxis protein
LKKFGLEADVTSSREDALSKLLKNSYVFATLDLSLHPDKESYEGLEFLRELEQSDISIPIFVISANAVLEYTIDACNFENVVHYCAKSLFNTKQSKAELDRKISKILESPLRHSRYFPVAKKMSKDDININLLEYSLLGKKRCYILFMDCEYFTKYDDEQQSKIFTTLINAAKGVEIIREASKGDGFIPILTGDGMAIIFSSENYSLFPLKLAFQIQERIHNEVLNYAIRFGIHYGDVYLFENPVGLKQLIGSQLNRTARIMDFGYGGHILSSKEYYTQYVLKTSDVNIDGISKKELGTYKHPKGEEFILYNYFTERYGNKSEKLRLKIG